MTDLHSQLAALAEKVGWIDGETSSDRSALSEIHEALLTLAAQSARAADDSEDDLIRERDGLEKVIDRMLDVVLGKDREEWSSAYGYADAIDDVEGRMAELESQPAQAAAAVPDGLVLVPRKPTPEMLQSAAFAVSGKTGCQFNEMASACYAAMLSAAPAPAAVKESLTVAQPETLDEGLERVIREISDEIPQPEANHPETPDSSFSEGEAVGDAISVLREIAKETSASNATVAADRMQRLARDFLSEQPKPAEGGAVSETTRALIEMLTQRDATGRAKYGTTLDRTDLTHKDWLLHMAEEMLDGAGYALAAIRTAALAGSGEAVATLTIEVDGSVFAAPNIRAESMPTGEHNLYAHAPPAWDAELAARLRKYAEAEDLQQQERADLRSAARRLAGGGGE